MPSLKPKAAALSLLAVAAVMLLAVGFRLDGLPFTPGAAYSDAATSHYPAAVFLRFSVVEHGEFPIWRETFMAGAPFAANPLNKTAYPPQWLAMAFEPLALLNALIVLHLALAGWGMARWARSLGISLAGAVVSALAYMFAPRLLIGLGAGHLDLLYAMAWWPWLMGGAHALGAKPSWRGAVWAGFVAGMVVLADLRLALYALPAAGVAFAIGWGRAGRPWAGVRQAGLACAIAAGLAVSVISPLAGWSPWLNRSSLTAAEAGVFSLTPGNLLALFAPLPSASLETITYLGVSTLLLAVIGVLRLPVRWRWGAAGVLSLVSLWALGVNGPLWPLLAGQGGLLAWFRVPARAWSVVVLLAALLAGLGADALLRAAASGSPVRGQALRRARLGAFGLLVASASAGALLLTIPAARASGLHHLLAGGGLGVLLLLLLAGRLRGQALVAGLLLVMTVDAACGARAWVEWRPSSAWLTPYDELVTFLRDDGAARVYSPDYRVPQEAMAEAGFSLFGGVDPFQIAGVTNAIRRAGGITATGYSVVVPPLDEVAASGQFALLAELDAALLAEWDVSHIVTGFPLERQGLDLAAEIGGSFVYRNALYSPHPSRTEPPDYPDGWLDLPAEADVAWLNALTWNAWLVSAGMMALVAALLLFGAVYRREVRV